MEGGLARNVESAREMSLAEEADDDILLIPFSSTPEAEAAPIPVARPVPRILIRLDMYPLRYCPWLAELGESEVPFVVTEVTEEPVSSGISGLDAIELEVEEGV
jgi:hypothetical protein